VWGKLVGYQYIETKEKNPKATLVDRSQLEIEQFQELLASKIAVNWMNCPIFSKEVVMVS
jgi:hypothetical protein